MRDKGVIMFSVFLAGAYIVASILLPVPIFIKIENLIYAFLYLISAYIVEKGTYIPIISLIFFNLGRLSRSIILPTGDIAQTAFEHIPMVIYLIIFAIYVIYKSYRE